MGIDFRARDFLHPFGIWRLNQSLARSQWFDAEELAALQDGLVRRMVSHAYDHVPYYRDLFRSLGLMPGDICRAADLVCLPRMTKATIRREYMRLRADNADRFGAYPVQTSGTTGEPVRFLLDRSANVLEFAYYWRWFGWCGYRLGDRLAELSAAYFFRRPACADQPCQLQRHCGRLLLNCIEFSPARTKLLAAAVRRYHPRYLKGTPSAVSQFAMSLQELGVDDLRFRAVFCTGEMLLPASRRLIGDTFRAPVFDGYGHMERTVAVCECPSGSLHVNPEYGVLELVDDAAIGNSATRRSLAVGTGLHCFAMPLLRYETGDVIEYESQVSRCACGRNLPRVLRVEGRLHDRILTPDGRRITTMFLVIDQAAGIRRGQIVQDRLDHLLVRIAPMEDWTGAHERELIRNLRRFTGAEMRITIQRETEASLRPVPGRKWRTVISEIAAAAPKV